MDNAEIWIVFGVVVIGFVGSVVYYFSRFYFSAGQEDPHSKVEGGPEVEPVGEPKSALEAKAQAEARAERTKDVAEALANTKSSFLGKMAQIFSMERTLSEKDLEDLEEVLYTSDLGTKTVQRLVTSVGKKLRSGEKSNLDRVREALRGEMLEIFSRCEEPTDEAVHLPIWLTRKMSSGPIVWMVVGVNGAGKTTTIGKLANKVCQQGRKVMIVAGDTFRAAAKDQLKVWSERAQVEIFSPAGVKDPSAVAFDGVKKAVASGIDIVIVDTAGRLHTQENLMEELKKMRRVIEKALPGAPHEILLIVDANAGQNSLLQAVNFHQALGLSGVILTKLDGTAKGGIAVGIANELQLPIKIVGVGEGIEDLRAFNSREFVESII